MKYRILTGHVPGKSFTVQVRRWGFWCDLFCASADDSPELFLTVEAAEARIAQTHPFRTNRRAYVVKEIILP